MWRLCCGTSSRSSRFPRTSGPCKGRRPGRHREGNRGHRQHCFEEVKSARSSRANHNHDKNSHLHRRALRGDPRHSSLVAKGAINPLRAVPKLIDGNYTGDWLLRRHRCCRLRLLCVQVCRHLFHRRRLLARDLVGVCRFFGPPWRVCWGRGLDVRYRRGRLGLLFVFLHLAEWDVSWR